MSERDLLVIGGGVAGWVAARRAQQLGLRVTVIEKFSEGPGFGSGRMSGGVFHAAYTDPLRSPDDLWRTINWATDGAARPDVARTWADNCGRALQFLMGEGARVGQKGYFAWMRRTLMPFGSRAPSVPLTERWLGCGPDVLLTAMWQTFVASGGDFRAGVRALELITDGVPVVGVRTDSTDVEAERVLLADGGFHANKALGKKYFGSDGYVIRAAMSNVGDALQMAQAVDASTVNLSQFYGHIQHRAALEDNRLWPQPSLDYIAEGGLVITLSGERLGISGSGFMHVAHEIVRSRSPLDTWVVLDEVGWQTLAALDGISVLESLGARLEQSDTIEDLARRIGIPQRTLLNAVDVHNHESDRPPSLPDSGEGLAHPPVLRVKIESPPFRAVPIIVGITFPLGGILVNGNAEVLRGDQPIPGLYAAGNAMGGLHGGPNHGYAGGWSQAAVFGMVAAEHAASSRLTPATRS